MRNDSFRTSDTKEETLASKIQAVWLPRSLGRRKIAKNWPGNKLLPVSISPSVSAEEDCIKQRRVTKITRTAI
jgi:hypothetical protein